MPCETGQKHPRKNARGFTLIETLVVIVILAILIGVIIITVGGVFGEAKDSAYKESKDQIQRAVTAYTATKASLLPILPGQYTNDDCNDCNVIDINVLLRINDGLLRQAPTGLNLSADGNDNCGGNASLGCKTGGSYIWIVNNDGTVFSYCTKPGTGGSNNSGYQNVWP